MAIQIKSYNQILGDMIRKIIAETSLNDINTGSVLLTLLEAVASNDFENNTAILNVLELLNIDAVKNNDLDARAADFSLSRRAAVKASGLVNISNTNIVKRSTGLYVIKPAPIAGQTKIYVNDASEWASTGSLYIGRGTQSFEGPLTYTSIADYTTYYEITLSSALQKDHLISDTVIDSQGEPDRVIGAGTVVKIPANNQNPEIKYTTLRDAVIPSGEDSVGNIEVIALVAGSSANAGINTITQFDSPPFTGAAVTNISAFSNGRDVETDVELRNRIKSYSITLARGTSPSITSAIIGVSDPDDSKQVASAIITEPVTVGAPSIIYIDDGTGFQPSFAGQSVDILLSDANGTEEFLQLANYPVPRPQVINVAEGPFNIKDGSFLRVTVDGTEETIYFTSSQFLNISAATTAEIVTAVNDYSTIFKARFTNNGINMLLYPVAYDAEVIQVASLRASDDSSLYINNLLKFPTDEFSYISLYQNSTRLREKSKSAELTTSPYAQWNITTVSNIIIAVDGTPAQDRSFALSDFPGAASFVSLSLNDWVDAFNRKFAGLTAIATPSQTMIIKSNKEGAESTISVTGGDLLNKWFPSLPKSSSGQTAQFQLNRQTGNIRVLTDIEVGDNISAGVEDAKGFIISSSTNSGTYNLSSDSFGRPANMVIVVDSTYCNQISVPLLVGGTLSILNPSGDRMRILSSAADSFARLKPSDFIYITPRASGWLNSANTGLFKIKAKGNHTVAGVDTYIEVENIGVVVESSISIADSLDVRGFETDGFPQIWRGLYLTNPPAEPISGLINSLNKDLSGVLATLYKSNSIKITSTSENNGSIAIPVAISNASVIFAETEEVQVGNPTHIATRASSKALTGIFKRTNPVDTNVFLDRHIYTDVKGSLSSNSIPDSAPYIGTYSENIESSGVLTSNQVELDNYVSFTRGNNRNQIRSIKAKIAGDRVGTQQDTARTELDHTTQDEIQLVESLSLSSEDSIVVVMDKDPTIKTVDIKMARTGRVNSGSLGSFIPTTTEFSADDEDNEPGINFGNTNVWGTIINQTNFDDYSVWMRSRNWYSTGGISGTGGKMLVRSVQYGPNGDKLRFSIGYPSTPDQLPTTTYLNTPSYSTFSYFFGSGPPKSTALAAGDTIAVSGPYADTSVNFPSGAPSVSGDYYDYTFSSGSLAAAVIGDIISIVPGSGISSNNSGQFSILNKSGLTIRIFNPNGSSTAPGTPEVVTVNTIADIVGTPTSYTIDTVADIGGSLDLNYFIIYDTQGSVAVWYDVDNSGAPPPPHGANRAIKVATVATGDSAATVASKTGIVIALDAAFNIGVIGNQLTVTNKINGNLSSASAGTSGFTVSTTVGTANQSLDGKYFTIYDSQGSVAIWYDIGDDGTSEPFHGAERSIKINTISYGASAATVAAATAAAINADAEFSASNLSSTITITNSSNGNVPAASAGTSGFTVGSVSGTLATDELITNASSIYLFPLVGTDVATIASTVNAKNIIELTPVGSDSLTITRSTKEDSYIYTGNSGALAYNHNPDDSILREYVSLYDGENWVKSFQNSNPNFTTKKPFILNGIAPSIYQMNSAPNYNSASLGEVLKLIPTTIKNFYHHLTQKALSQLPIISNIRISNDRKNVQITSKSLGSSGAVEMIGGSANKAQAYLETESEVSSDTSGDYLLIKIPAYPDTFNIGDYIKLENDSGVKRLSRLIATDTISVTNPSIGVIEYNYDPKIINVSSSTQFSISDVSALYGRPSGYVWRWTHDGSATLSQVQAGDQVMAFGPNLVWDQGNKIRSVGDNNVGGIPIIYVNDASDFFDVINPHGRSMSLTSVGIGNTVQICPAPVIRWSLSHAARTHITSMVRVGTTVTVTCANSHMLNTGDSIDIIDSDNVVDGTYSSIVVTSPNQFTFNYGSGSFNEIESGATVIKSGLVPTRYRIEKLGVNGTIRISRQDGESPRFTDNGVAVDDYVLISGNTFASNNSGTFRVLAVDNNSIIISNDTATDELNTVVDFNNKDLYATWTSNTNVVTGAAGTFKNVNVGDWVKKPEDPDSYYAQVLAMVPTTPALTTSITLGTSYSGSSAIAPGVSYDMTNDYDKGVFLNSIDDIAFYEGDSVIVGDTLYIQNIVNSNWFSSNNVGSFEIVESGTNAITYKPFIRINNSIGSAEANRSMSVSVAGFYVIEGLANKFSSIRKIEHVALDDLNSNRRSLYITPHNRSYKFTDSNLTSITSMGKLGYSTDVTTGIDGYLYYTGLLRRVQRIIDGYEPDADNFPGRRAVGGLIETLPPLNKKISVTIDVTTDEGVNLGDISSNIKSVIINYVSTLGVGEDVILSEITAAVMQIRGVGAVTFTNPAPSTERITIADNEKATINPSDIGIA